MRVCFWHSDKPREQLLGDAFAEGVRALGLGDTVEQRALLPEPAVADCDVAVMIGVKSRALFQAHWDAGIHVVMLDKGYTRHAAPGPVKLWEYWRVAVDAHHPTETLMSIARPPDRLERLGLELKPWRFPFGDDGRAVLIAGSSAKYHEFYGMRDPTRWATKVAREIATRAPRREIIYRPKPSWKDAAPIPGTTYSADREPIESVLQRTAVMVTHGSNACFEAALAGVPTIVLGTAVAKPISATSLEVLATGDWPIRRCADLREQWLANLAYCQWTMPEFASGEAWRCIRPQIFGAPR